MESLAQNMTVFLSAIALIFGINFDSFAGESRLMEKKEVKVEILSASEYEEILEIVSDLEVISEKKVTVFDENNDVVFEGKASKATAMIVNSDVIMELDNTTFLRLR